MFVVAVMAVATMEISMDGTSQTATNGRSQRCGVASTDRYQVMAPTCPNGKMRRTTTTKVVAVATKVATTIKKGVIGTTKAALVKAINPAKLVANSEKTKMGKIKAREEKAKVEKAMVTTEKEKAQKDGQTYGPTLTGRERNSAEISMEI